MSTIKADNIAKGANSTDMDNAIFGSAKAWINCDANGGTIRSSYNVSSITDGGLSTETVNFATAMPNADYCVTGTANGSTTTFNVGRFICPYDLTTTSVTLTAQSASNSGSPAPIFCVAVFST